MPVLRRALLCLLPMLPLLTACPRDADCQKLSLEACANEPACFVVTGRRILDEGGQCILLDRSEPLRCVDNRNSRDSCGFFTQFADPGDGTCYNIGTACVPDAWSACEENYDTGDICR